MSPPQRLLIRQTFLCRLPTTTNRRACYEDAVCVYVRKGGGGGFQVAGEVVRERPRERNYSQPSTF
jgi:hypothetical protein